MDSRYLAYNISYILSNLGYPHRLIGYRSSPTHHIISIQFPLFQRIGELLKRSDEIALWMGLEELTISQKIGYLDFAIPRGDRKTVKLTDLLQKIDPDLLRKGIKFPLGVDQSNCIRIANLQDPSTCHVGIMGQSGSGKSICLAGILYSLIQYHSPKDLRICLIDPTDSLDQFDGAPHLLEGKVASTPKDIKTSVEYAVRELERRYRDEITDYSLIVVIDELATTISNSPDLIEGLQYITSTGRKRDVHLIASSQKWSDRYFSGSSQLLSNISLKICFKVSNSTDSGLLGSGLKLDKLRGSGDCYCIASSTERIQNPYIFDDEIREYIEQIRDDEPQETQFASLEAREDEDIELEKYEKLPNNSLIELRERNTLSRAEAEKIFGLGSTAVRAKIQELKELAILIEGEGYRAAPRVNKKLIELILEARQPNQQPNTKIYQLQPRATTQ